MPRLLICDGPPPSSVRTDAATQIWTHSEFSARLRGGGMRRYLFRFSAVTMVLPHLGLRPRPLLVSLVLRLLSRSRPEIVDERDARVRLGLWQLVSRAMHTVAEAIQLPFLLRGVRRELGQLEHRLSHRVHQAPQAGGASLYLKTDMWFSTQVGGSVTHMAGVVNHLRLHNGPPPLVFTTAANPMVDAGIACRPLLPAARFWDFREVPAMLFSRSARRDVLAALGPENPALVYQRYCLNNYAAVMVALDLGIPLVTEYNGSEVWISQHWGRPAAHPELSAQIEMLNLRAADLVVVVSQVLQDELVARGIEAERILVNPNGVDPALFDPALDATRLRHSLHLQDKTVIGFIGTFGPWHGTEELVDAFADLLQDEPRGHSPLHLLMVGQGARHAAAVARASKRGISERCTFTGQVPQTSAPQYLACCDLLVAPHVPNADGSPFFGSPTKLFEYMSMGRPIVASALGQIAEVLEHRTTAWLVEPGNVTALTDGMRAVLEQPGLAAGLGQAAREAVLARHSWRHHTDRILRALTQVRT